MALGTLKKYVSRDLIFRIDKCKTSKEAWDKLAQLYGKIDEIRGYKLDNDLTSLDPKNFDTIQDYVTKANELRAQLKDCGIDKDAQFVFNLLDKLPSEYAAFVSSSQTHRLTMGSAYTTPSFDSFIEMLMLEQTKLITVGILKSSKSQALVATHGSGSSKKQKQSKNKPHKDRAQSSSPQQGDSSSSSNKGNSQKEKPTCAYCKKVGHDEHRCHAKQVDELTNLLKKNNINFPSSYKKEASLSTSSQSKKGKGQALVAATRLSQKWILDSSATHHMGSDREQFSSLEPCTVPHILIGDDT